MAKLYSETFINIMDTICAHCNARTDDCYVDGDDAEDCLLFGDDMLEMLRLCVRVDDLAHQLEKAADVVDRNDHDYWGGVDFGYAMHY